VVPRAVCKNPLCGLRAGRALAPHPRARTPGHAPVKQQALHKKLWRCHRGEAGRELMFLCPREIANVVFWCKFIKDG